MDLQLQGKITSWNDEKGYGFITPGSRGNRIFVHINNLRNHHGQPVLDQRVTFILAKDRQGRTCAADVAFIGKQPKNPVIRKRQKAALILIALFFTALGILTIIQIIPLFIIALYAVASAVTFIAYAIDKSAARKEGWRTAEATLHTMSLFGGWPGALIAQQTLRHKSSKAEFQGAFKFTALLNLAVTTWLLTPRGPELTMAFIEKLETMMK